MSSQAVYNAAAEMYAQLVGTELSAAFEARRPLAATHGALFFRDDLDTFEGAHSA